MAGWDDLVEKAQPALLGGGLKVTGLAEGSTWRVTLVIKDKTGTLVPWTGVTGAGTIYSAREDGFVITTWDVSLPSAGVLVLSKDIADTTGLENQDAAHSVFLTKAGTPDERIAVCLPWNSPCPIRSED